jgi:hypothetical protein
MAMGIFGTMISNLNQMGFYDFVLPWLLIFAVVYAILQKAKILDNKPAEGIVSIVIAFFATSYTGVSLGSYMTGLFGGSSIFIAAALIFLVFAGLFGYKSGEGLFKEKKFLLVPAIIVILLFLSQNGLDVTGLSLTSESTSALVMVGIVALAVLFVTQEGGDDDKQKDN